MDIIQEQAAPEQPTYNHEAATESAANILLDSAGSEPDTEEAPANLEGGNFSPSEDELLEAASAVVEDRPELKAAEPETEAAAPEQETAAETPSDPVPQQQQQQPQNLPQQREQLLAKATELDQAVDSIIGMAERNEISQQDAQAALQRAREYGAQINQQGQQWSIANQQAEINQQAGNLARHTLRAKADEEVAKTIPDWSQPEKKAQIQQEMRNFLTDEGIDPAMISTIEDPALVKLIHKTMKQNQQHVQEGARQKAIDFKAAQIKKARAKARNNGRPSMNQSTAQLAAMGRVQRSNGEYHDMSTEQKTSQIANLLSGL